MNADLTIPPAERMLGDLYSQLTCSPVQLIKTAKVIWENRLVEIKYPANNDNSSALEFELGRILFFTNTQKLINLLGYYSAALEIAKPSNERTVLRRVFAVAVTLDDLRILKLFERIYPGLARQMLKQFSQGYYSANTKPPTIEGYVWNSSDITVRKARTAVESGAFSDVIFHTTNIVKSFSGNELANLETRRTTLRRNINRFNCVVCNTHSLAWVLKEAQQVTLSLQELTDRIEPASAAEINAVEQAVEKLRQRQPSVSPGTAATIWRHIIPASKDVGEGHCDVRLQQYLKRLKSQFQAVHASEGTEIDPVEAIQCRIQRQPGLPYINRKFVVPVRLCLLVDASGSMNGTPIKSAAILHSFLNSNLLSQHKAKVSHWYYTGEDHGQLTLMSSSKPLADPHQFISAGGTPTCEALAALLPKLQKSNAKTIVFHITDGLPHLDDDDIPGLQVVTSKYRNLGYRLHHWVLGSYSRKKDRLLFDTLDTVFGQSSWTVVPTHKIQETVVRSFQTELKSFYKWNSF